MTKSGNSKNPLSKNRTTLTIRPEALTALQASRAKLHYNNNSDLIIALAAKTDALIPIATLEAVIASKTPVIITGLPGSGKTTLAKKLAVGLPPPFLIVDPHDQYDGFEKVGTGAMYQFDYERLDCRIRFVPSSEYSRENEATTIFNGLALNKSRLSNWSFIVDESHFIADVPAFRNFVIEARKYVNKLIIICTDYQRFEGLGVVMTPPPFTVEEAV